MKSYGKIVQFLLLGSILIVCSLIGWRWWRNNKPPAYQVSLLNNSLVPVWKGPDTVAMSDAEKAELFTLEKQLFEASVSAQSYVVIDTQTETVLLEKNSTKLLPPASTTKLMTALVARELYDLDEVVHVSTLATKENNGGGLTPEENVLLGDLLAAALVSSANDAAFAIAHHLEATSSANPPGFVAKMNEAAQELNLKDTIFENPAGYDSPTHLSTARDLAILIRTATGDPEIKRLLGLESYVIENQEKNLQHFLYTTNEFLGQSLGEKYGIVAGKTGTTELAGEVLASLIKHDGRELVIVVMNSENRYLDTIKLLDWVNTHYEWQEAAVNLQVILDSARESL